METSTSTRENEPAGAGAGGQLHTRLVFIADTEIPGLSSSNHSLDDIDEVRFRRGERCVERERRVLTLRFPDSRMSSEHGCLRRRDACWMLDDPFSKNGSIVDGALARHSYLRDGSVIELGRSFFLFRHTSVRTVPTHLSGDVDAEHLPPWPPGMATFSPSLACSFEALTRFATSPGSLVLRGETGTGKEVIARAVHELSRRAGEFVAVNCGALPATLVEAELFGHRRGAFSGSLSDRKGLVRSADGGTLFLDEIGELPQAAQAALLRVLQEREVLPVGDDRPIAVNLRLITATLRDLEAEITAGRFRADLYARIVGHVVVLPRLRERQEDLGLLLATLIPVNTDGRVIRLAPAVLRALLRHDWPHNIRELEQGLASAIALAPHAVIELEHLPDSVIGHKPAGLTPPSGTAAAELDADDRELRAKLVALLETHEGKVVKVARALGKQRAQIYKWVDRFAIDLSVFRRTS